MIDSRQQAYLEAMDVEVWRLRETHSAGLTLPEPALSEPTLSELGLSKPVFSELAPPQSSLPEKPFAEKDLGLKLGPGGGGILLICAIDSDSSSRLSNDISRVMNGTPVWAWPHAGDNTVRLANAIENNLFTTAAVFGDELAEQLFDGDFPASLNSANLVLLPAMQDLKNNADARKELWQALCRAGMVKACDQQT